ncbi:MAG TPA: pyridoxal 5'-phosphate synthase glutaminase subunit PdxT [Sandaracinaceae bacterium LLY-WYZ-13_1]|nr:pyridoxal 5'-phosphate synthase glutaminase subunit PdxT [Sandaracinaceae bacterium LLY-WYZ-13_1]
MRVGVLALQGGWAAHLACLRGLGHRAVEVRSPRALDGLDGLVLPGGESTAQWRLLTRAPGLAEALRSFAGSGAPVLVTCAGLVLAARAVAPTQPSLDLLDVCVRRNGWGRQLASAEARADDGTPLVLIRAPRIEAVGDGVTVETTLDGEPVLVRQANVWGATYHPELAGDLRAYARPFRRGW